VLVLTSLRSSFQPFTPALTMDVMWEWTSLILQVQSQTTDKRYVFFAWSTGIKDQLREMYTQKQGFSKALN
jgi:hypothetical protein